MDESGPASWLAGVGCSRAAVGGGQPVVDEPTASEGNAWQRLVERGRRQRKRRRREREATSETSRGDHAPRDPEAEPSIGDAQGGKDATPRDPEAEPSIGDAQGGEDATPRWEACPWPWCEESTCRLEQRPSRKERRGGRRAAEIVLTTCERRRLEEVVRAARSSQRDAQRARVVLLAARGRTNREIGATLGVEANTAGRWRTRYQTEGPKGLRDAPRSGRPPTYKPEEKALFLQKALESARDNGVPISRWTCKELVEFAKRAGMGPTPDPATLWRWLDQADVKPHKWRYWLQITDPDFETRMKDVTGIYLQAIALAKAGTPVFCVDEKTGMQALERERPDRPTRPGKARRRDHRYKRHGTACLIGVFHVATGKVWGRFTPNRDSTTFAALLAEVCESVPNAAAIHFVMDQLNTHWSLEVRKVVTKASGLTCCPEKLRTGRQRKAFLLEVDKRVVFHFTPLRASWLDQIEIWFSILSRKLLAVESFTSLEDLKAKVSAFVEHYNRYLAHPFRWTYTGAPCRA